MTPATLAAVLERLQEYAPDEATNARLGDAAVAVRRSGAELLRDAVTSFGAQALEQKLGLH